MAFIIVFSILANLATLMFMALMWFDGTIEADDFMFREGFKVKHLLWVFVIPSIIIAYICVIINMLIESATDSDDNFWNKKLF